MNWERLRRVRHSMETHGIPQLLLNDPYAIYYLTGEWVETGERLLALYLTVQGEICLFYNQMFSISADLPIERVSYSDTEDPIPLLAGCIQADELLGVDKNFPARFLLPLLERCPVPACRNASICVDEVRACKDAEEQEQMRRVSAINDNAMACFRELLHAGTTEREVANALQEIYCRHGADGLAFPPTVDFAADAAVSHHAPEGTPLRPGDCALFDVGCKLQRYCADMSRTFFLKEVSHELETVYELVKRANLAAEALIRPGVPLCEIDLAARSLIEEAGYGPRFTHRLGHFIGLEVHEVGDVSKTAKATAQPGNIFSVEPGIYLPETGGIRIEDLVLVTEDGCEILNHFSKELQIVG